MNFFKVRSHCLKKKHLDGAPPVASHSPKKLRTYHIVLIGDIVRGDSSILVLSYFFSYGASTRFRVMTYPYRASQSHSVDTKHSVRLLWMSDQPVVEISLPDNTPHLQETYIHAPGGIRTRNPSKLATAHPHLRPSGHRNRLCIIGT